MSISKVEICNLALSRIGQGKINSLDDRTETARILDLNYNNALKETLEIYPWAFAKRVQLLALTDDTTPGWQYVYQYPVNCAKVWRVFSEADARTYKKSNFDEITNGAEKFLACDIEDAYAEYSYFVQDPNLYSASFTGAFVFKLAEFVALSLVANSGKASEMHQEFELAISRAQLSSATERNVPPEWPTSYIKGRR